MAAIALALASTACGRPPPQAPPAQTTILDNATTAISTLCGKADEITAFPGEHRRGLAELDRRAQASARALARVLHRNAAWLYQGASVRELVGDSVAMLRSCDLSEAARTLERASR